jgi:hypothetical protein
VIRVSIRSLTAIALIVISGIGVAHGWVIVRFFLASTNIVSAEKRARIGDASRATSGVTSTILKDELADETNRSDIIAPYHRRELLAAILSIEPLSSMDWLSRSKAELMTHQPMDDVFGSLELSMLTGPNEGYVMPDRRYFGVSLWDRLPPDLKRRVATDLVMGDIIGNEKFQAALSPQHERVRNELRDAVIATGVSRKEIEKRLGLLGPFPSSGGRVFAGSSQIQKGWIGGMRPLSCATTAASSSLTGLLTLRDHAAESVGDRARMLGARRLWCLLCLWCLLWLRRLIGQAKSLLHDALAIGAA